MALRQAQDLLVCNALGYYYYLVFPFGLEPLSYSIRKVPKTLYTIFSTTNLGLQSCQTVFPLKVVQNLVIVSIGAKSTLVVI